MALTKQSISILNGNYVIPKDVGLQCGLAELSPDPTAKQELVAAASPVAKPALMLSEVRTTTNSGIKFVQLVLEQPASRAAPPRQHQLPAKEEIKPEKKTETSENICTICGETYPEKTAFNAHIKAHLKEKLNNKLGNKTQKSKAVSKAIITKMVPALEVRNNKRKLECSEAEQPSSKVRLLESVAKPIKLEPPELPPVAAVKLEPQVSHFEENFLNTEFSKEMELNRLELNNDLSSILDQIEKDFEGPDLSLQNVNLDSSTDTDSTDILRFLDKEADCMGESGLASLLDSPPASLQPSPMLMVSPRLAENSNDLEQQLLSVEAGDRGAGDHDYLPVGGGEEEAAGSPAPLPARLVLARPAPAQTRLLSLVRMGETAVPSPAQLPAQTNMPANAKIIETSRGSEGEKEYKIVLGADRESPRNKIAGKSKQTADCSICGKSITTKNMARHMEKHTGKKKFQCEICLASFFQKTHLKNHIVLHESGEYHECQDCKQKFLRKADLQKHQKTVHCIEVLLSCNVCGAQFSEQQKLEFHKRSHGRDKKELCGLCGEKFEDKEAMIAHMQQHTSPIIDKPFSCGVCQKNFAQKGHLNRHLKSHSEQAELVCGVCSKQCRSRYELVRHRATHLACAACSAVFDTRGQLAQHSLACSVAGHQALLSPGGSSSSHDLDLFEEESNSSSGLSLTNGEFFQSSLNVSPEYSAESPNLDSFEHFGSFLNDFDSDGPLINDSVGGEKSFSPSSDEIMNSRNITLDDISDSSFFDISHQLDEDIYDADLFASMK